MSNDNELHEPHELDSLFQPGKLISLLEIIGGGVATCDLCGRWRQFVALGESDAREQLTRAGWQFRGEQDVCSRCATTERTD